MSETYDYSFVKMNEEDTKLKLITPAVEKAGWDKMRQMFCEYSYTDGEIIVRGKMTTRGKRKKVECTSATSPLRSSRPKTRSTRSGRACSRA